MFWPSPSSDITNTSYNCQWGNNHRGLLILSRSKQSCKWRGKGKRQKYFQLVFWGPGADKQMSWEWGQGRFQTLRGNYQVNKSSANKLSTSMYKFKVIQPITILWFLSSRKPTILLLFSKVSLPGGWKGESIHVHVCGVFPQSHLLVQLFKKFTTIYWTIIQIG